MSDEREPEGFVMMPRWLQRDPNVSVHAKLLYLAIASRVGSRGARVSQKTLAADSSMGVSTARRAQAELVALGVIEVRPCTRQDGGQGANQYRLLVDRTGADGRPDLTGGPARSEQGPPPAVAEQEEEFSLEVEVPTGTSASAPAKPDEFETFWRQYPRHAGSSKADARKAYGRAVNRAGSLEVLAGVARFAADPNLPEERFIPHASTWLNQDRWESAPLPARGGGQDLAGLVARAAQRDHAERGIGS